MEAFRTSHPATPDCLDSRLSWPSIVLPGSPDYDEARQVHLAKQTADLPSRRGCVRRRMHGHPRPGVRPRVVDPRRRPQPRRLRHQWTAASSSISATKGLHMDPERRLAWAQPGLTAEEYTVAAAAHGLATPFGDNGFVGIAGLVSATSARAQVRHGHRCPRSGGDRHGRRRQVTASADSGPVLGGPWRRATSASSPGSSSGCIRSARSSAARVVHARDAGRPAPPLVPIASSAPEELTTISMLMRIPPAPLISGQSARRRSSSMSLGRAPGRRQAAIQPFREVAAPLIDDADAPYPANESSARPNSARWRSTGSRFLSTIDATAAADAVLEAMAAPSSPTTMIQLRVLGGAMATSRRRRPSRIAMPGSWP